jgi:hypothetical protein
MPVLFLPKGFRCIFVLAGCDEECDCEVVSRPNSLPS